VTRPRVMGIVNVTPDSFSDGGRFLDPERAIAHGRRLVAQGADILDIGGESTRPGAQAVSAEDELGRVEPVVAGLAGTAPVSIDTSKALVAAAALDRGAEIVNDVTALRADPDLAGLCAERGCTVVLMHMLGSPRTMQDDPRYEDVVDEVRRFLAGRVEAAVSAGVAEERIWVDPGIGFGKKVEHNLELLRRLREIATLGRPVVIGSSRKRFLGEITGRELGERLGGTIASNVLALAAGADVFRVHDVAEARQALDAAEAILGRRDWREPPRPVHAR
jgi:dihydropteroate synthase